MPTARAISNARRCLFSGGLLIAVLCPCIAAAALGEPETSVQTDVARLRGSITVTSHANYKLHEIQLPSGTQLREFAGLDGKVFAVAWNGPAVPDLRQTLGQYFDNYLTAAKAQSEAMGKAKRSLRAAADQATKENKGYRVVSGVPVLKDGHPVAEVTLVKGSEFKAVSEKLN